MLSMYNTVVMDYLTQLIKCVLKGNLWYEDMKLCVQLCSQIIRYCLFYDKSNYLTIAY